MPRKVVRQKANGDAGICIVMEDGTHVEVAESEWSDEPSDEAKQDKINELLDARGSAGVTASVEGGVVTLTTGNG